MFAGVQQTATWKQNKVERNETKRAKLARNRLLKLFITVPTKSLDEFSAVWAEPCIYIECRYWMRWYIPSGIRMHGTIYCKWKYFGEISFILLDEDLVDGTDTSNICASSLCSLPHTQKGAAINNTLNSWWIIIANFALTIAAAFVISKVCFDYGGRFRNN